MTAHRIGGLFLSLLLLSETSRMQRREGEVRYVGRHVLLGFEKLFLEAVCDSEVVSICKTRRVPRAR